MQGKANPVKEGFGYTYRIHAVHFFATHLLEGDTDLRYIQEIEMASMLKVIREL